MTQTIRYVIAALSPLAVSERKPGGQFRKSWPYIPGALVRGAVAEILLKQVRRDHDCDGFHADVPQQRATCLFYQAFCTDGAAVFGNAYPTRKGTVPRVLPATVVTCKDCSGFARKCLDANEETSCRVTKDGDHHGVFDTLIDRLCWEELASAAMVYNPLCPEYDPADERCSGRVDKFGGFYVVQRSPSEKLADVRLSLREWLAAECKPEGLYCFRQASVSQRILTRVAINRRRGVAEDQLLYSPSVLTEGRKIRKSGGEVEYKSSQFIGMIQTNDTTRQTIRQALEQVQYLGGGSSRGLGRVKIDILDEDEGTSVEDRIAAFNRVLRGQWALYKQLTGIAGHRYDGGHFFVVDLQSDAVLKEHGWLPTMVLTAEMLKEATGVTDDTLDLRRSYATYGYRGGWQSAWGLPKDTEVTAAMGSCYVFWTGDIGKWEKALVDLETRGIGERRAEGFGQVRVCDEVHLILREVAQ